jgi:hypothetical protein
VRQLASFALAASLLAFVPAPSNAAPSLGGARPDVAFVDAWDRALVLPKTSGKPVLLVYEDKDSANQNAALKSELSTLARGDAYKHRVVLLAVADVSGYDYWPARGFVRDAIRSESVKLGTPIYCDWNGQVRNTLALEAKRSNVVFYGKDGRVLFSHAGTLPEAKRNELVKLMKDTLATR